jgi:glycosyltransferase involved in cell wall biosynthesis
MIRIAAVQHGDWAEARRLIASGRREPYFGMAYTLRVLGDLFAGRPHLVISLDAPGGGEVSGDEALVGLPPPRWPVESLGEIAWARRVRAELERFRPTHVLLRAGGFLAIAVLEYARAHGASTLVVFAGAFDEGSWITRRVNRRLVRLLREPCVFLVGNHKEPATQSMVALGVPRDRAVAWDWPNARHPREHLPKRLASAGERRVLFVGSISEPKGVGDLVEAVQRLRADGEPFSLDVVGDGPALGALRARLGAAAGAGIRLVGRVGNDEAFRLMLDATIACVPSRHEFSEGMPLTLTEALASRTPVAISDHPVFSVFRDREGVRVFPARDPAALARVLREMVADPDEYARLSRSTLDAFERVECPTSFGDLVERWRASFPEPGADAGGAPRVGSAG